MKKWQSQKNKKILIFNIYLLITLRIVNIKSAILSA